MWNVKTATQSKIGYRTDLLVDIYRGSIFFLYTTEAYGLNTLCLLMSIMI